jgi:cytochrome d ubiquinol oxidase subunit II
VGLLTTVLVAYLAAAYLFVEAGDHDLRTRFATRAMVSCTAVLLAAGLALWQARDGAPEIYAGLAHTTVGLMSILLAIFFHLAALVALWRLRSRPARWLAIGGAVVMLWGWALSQFPYLVEPHLTIAHAAPPPTLRLLFITLLVGSLVLFPLLYYLYRIFKGHLLPGG